MKTRLPARASAPLAGFAVAPVARRAGALAVGLFLGAGLLAQPPALAGQAGAAGGAASAERTDEPGPGALGPSGELVLRPGDIVRLQVKDEPFHGEFAVNEDGTVLFPVVGLVEVAGRPFGEVRAEVHAGFAREIVDPVVVMTPLVRLAVLGEVRAPGLFPVDPTMTLADVLARVGGLAPRADEGKISLVRGGEVAVARLEPGDVLLETRLRSGDQIVVGRQSWAREHMAVLVGAAASVTAATITSLILR